MVKNTPTVSIPKEEYEELIFFKKLARIIHEIISATKAQSHKE